MKYTPKEIAERINLNKPRPWRLMILKDDTRMVCIRSTIGTVDFVAQDSPFAVFGGEKFRTEEDAMQIWDQFKRKYPDLTEGWKPRTYQFEV